MDRLDPQYIRAIRYLYDRINYEKTVERPYNQQTFRLARMEYFLNQLGDPHLAAPVIHVAGTKGKGSVSWMVAETLRHAGRSVGLYTSPHLLDLEERFVINGQPCSPADWVNLLDRIEAAATATEQSNHGPPTFFEMTTALAWVLFADRKTDVNVMEVGLGGRLDSTNVCQSSLVIITSISFDHQQQLGNTISAIAAEKAGIIKPGVPVISGANHVEAQPVIRDRCQALGCALWELDVDFQVESKPITSSNAEAATNGGKRLASQLDFIPLKQNLGLNEMRGLRLKMVGKHQSTNAALAIAAWNRLNCDGWQLSKHSLESALEETQLSGRIEQVSHYPAVVIDTAHNVASIEALLIALDEHFEPCKRTIIFGCSKDKEYERMLHQILEGGDRLILTQFRNNPRAVLVERLEELARQQQSKFPDVEILSAPDVVTALEYAKKHSAPEELICIAGSFFLAAEAKSLFPSSKFPQLR